MTDHRVLLLPGEEEHTAASAVTTRNRVLLYGIVLISPKRSASYSLQTKEAFGGCPIPARFYGLML